VEAGAYNVAATNEHGELSNKVLHHAMIRSVRVRARKIVAPPLDDPAMVAEGGRDYHELCLPCHGGPGIERSDIGEGLEPEPPDLVERVPTWSDSEIFWIAKHGIKDAGMPSFGRTHTDEELWPIVAFVRRLPETSPDEFRRLAGEGAVAEGP
jgi:mono/diheme cytochrome c family protein